MVERHWEEVERERPQRSHDKGKSYISVIFLLKGCVCVCVCGSYSVAPPAVCLTCISHRFLCAARLPVAAGSTHSYQQGASNGEFGGVISWSTPWSIFSWWPVVVLQVK